MAPNKESLIIAIVSAFVHFFLSEMTDVYPQKQDIGIQGAYSNDKKVFMANYFGPIETI